jgi:hypothetical protein
MFTVAIDTVHHGFDTAFLLSLVGYFLPDTPAGATGTPA